MFNASPYPQIQWVFRRKRNLGNSCEEIRLRSYRCYNTEVRRFLSSKARRVSLVCLRREMRRIRDLLAGNPKRRYSASRRRASKVSDDIKFLNANVFSQLLTTMMHEKALSHIDAILELCNERNIDPESIPELLTPQMKKLIKNEAISLNFIRDKKKTRKLMV